MVTEKDEKKDEKLEEALEQEQESTETETEETEPDETALEQEKEKLEQKQAEHKARSDLGRKVKAMEDRLDTEMGSLHNKIDQLLNKDTEVETEYDEDWIPTTRKEMDDYLEMKLQKRDTIQKSNDQKYHRSYQGSVNNYSNENDYNEICKELEANFNVRRSDNGEVDGQLNYLKASKAYYRKKLSKPDKENPLKGKGNDLPLGAGVEGEKIIEKEEPMPKLDDAAQEYIKKTGMSKESVIKAMKKELPLGMQGIA